MHVTETNIRIIAIHESIAEQNRRLMKGEPLMSPQEAKQFTMTRVLHIEALDDLNRFEYVVNGRKDRMTQHDHA